MQRGYASTVQPKAVTHDLRCVGCRQILRGLLPSGVCPECSTPVMVSLVETLDLPSQALARPVHARRVAAALLGVGIGILLWLVAVTSPMLARGFAELGRAPLPLDGGPMDRVAVALSCLAALVFTVSAVLLARRDDDVLLMETGSARARLLWGVSIWCAASFAACVGAFFDLQSLTRLSNAGLWFVCLTVQLVAATVAASGLNRFAAALGRRCRRFRHAGHARQSLETMTVTGAITLVTSFGASVVPALASPDLGLTLRAISFVTGGLLILGGIYLVLNFWWIRQILNAPPPQLADVIRVVEPTARGDSPN
ncbi:MAG: hypothetical protein EBR10_02455 [Planctomycetes bacterium]|nr:hypothetical protein [Planctomycetota bacterium]